MLYIINESRDPFFNMAVEQYFLGLDLREDVFMLWQNRPAVVVGRHQNTHAEINGAFVKENNIQVVRRLSGGGAVYHDQGNVNFTFIKREVSRDKFDFSHFTGPVIKTLQQLGVAAEFTGRNDITIEGKKFSGNAQYFSRQGMLHHGTILFDSDLSVLVQALDVSKEKYVSRGVSSVRSRITNVSDHLPQPLDIEEFMALLVNAVRESSREALRQYRPSEGDLQKISLIADNKYRTWEWNFGPLPPFNYKQVKRLPGGTVSVYLEIEEGIIRGCKIYGDFFASGDLEELASCFLDRPYEKTFINKWAGQLQVEEYLHNISASELAGCFFESGE